MPEGLANDLLAARQRLAELGRERETTRQQAAAALADINQLRATIAARQAVGDREGAGAARATLDTALARRRELLQGAAGLGRSVVNIIDAIALDDLRAESDVPIALLPIRIETRSTAGRAQLRVRIYPDDIHVDQHDRGLSDVELAAGMSYWHSVWEADHPDAFVALVAIVGARRAPWVATALTPSNLAARPGEAPQFPPTEPRANQPAVVRMLPDRFHVFVDQGGVISEGVGRPIPDELVVGLSSGEEFVPIKDGSDLPAVDEAMRWMVDYDAAVASGMAVTLNLQRPGQRIDRLIVLGLRSTLAPEAAALLLERLLVAHRFSDGAAFLPQGTPTNNTESDRTAWTLPDAVPPPAATPPAIAGGSNADVLARLLGVGSASLADWPHAADAEQPRARAMNTALWAPTWEAMLERVLGSDKSDPQARLLSDRERDDVRSHFIERTRARGPIPALRLGKQPYGVLPTVATDAASFRAADGGTVEARLVPFLRELRAIWNLGVQNVPRVTAGDIDKTLPDILGTSPVMQGLRVRSVVTRNASYYPPILGLADSDNERAQEDVASIAWRLVQVEPTAVADNGALGKATRSLALPLTHDSDPAFIKALLDRGTGPTPKSVLQALLGLAAKTELARRDRLATIEEVDRIRSVAFDQVGQDVDQGLLRNAFAEVLQGAAAPEAAAKAAAVIEERAGRFDTQQLAARQVLPGLSTGSAFSALTGNGQQVAALNTGRAGLQIAGAVFAAAERQAAFRAALQVLEEIPSLEERALLLGETLDLASHRLDAWITSIATNRLARMRQQRTGTLLGAYGWVEDIELVEPRPTQVEGIDGPVFANPVDGGYIHAPSLTHAATAAVLRSGRLTHAPDDANQAALNIDLSSGRVREALCVIDGIRQGQSLGALLGYRLERMLHERSGNGIELDRFIYVLRGLAPLVAGKLTDRGAAQEATAASNVVDGIALLELPLNVVQAGLQAGPKDKTYIQENWQPPTPAESTAIQSALADLERIHDAVADVALAEGVHQLVKGNNNTARAAAALDAVGGGEAAPPQPDIVRTPRSGTSLTHRLAVVITEPTVSLAGWNSNAPRALAEPRLEAWGQAQFGPATQITLAADGAGNPAHTLADVGVCALDLLWEADGDDVASTSMGWRLRRAIPDLGLDLGTVLQPFAPTWELARSLRRLVANARPVVPARREQNGAVSWSVPTLFGRTLPATFEPGMAPSLKERAGQAQTALESVAQPFDESDEAAVRAAIDAMVPFGLRVPPRADLLPVAQLAPLASALVAEATRRADRAGTLIAQAGDDQPELLLNAFAAIFGDGFLALPLIAAPPTGDMLAAALGSSGVPASDGLEIRPWLARAAAVRAGVGRYAETLLYREALRGRVRLRVAQTPLPSLSTWIGLPFAAGEVVPTDPITGIVIESTPGPALTGTEALAGFIVDEWTDVVPRRVMVGDPDGPPDDRTIATIATTGVAVNANAPNARPPQAILLAISADGAAWSKDSLLHVIRDTLDLLRERSVTLERVPWAGRILPALYCRDWSLQGEAVINYKQLANEYTPSAALTFVKD